MELENIFGPPTMDIVESCFSLTYFDVICPIKGLVYCRSGYFIIDQLEDGQISLKYILGKKEADLLVVMDSLVRNLWIRE